MSKGWMKNIPKGATITLVFLSLSALAYGQQAQPVQQGRSHHHHGINERQRNQEERIQQGIRSGELTEKEATRLEEKEAKIKTDEEFARRSGGKLTPKELARIQRELNQASGDIHHEKNDHNSQFSQAERNQEKRIQHGIQSGALTQREATRLETEEAKIKTDEEFARKSGGKFTNAERRRINRDLNHASRDIYREKHDRNRQQ